MYDTMEAKPAAFWLKFWTVHKNEHTRARNITDFRQTKYLKIWVHIVKTIVQTPCTSNVNVLCVHSNLVYTFKYRKSSLVSSS